MKNNLYLSYKNVKIINRNLQSLMKNFLKYFFKNPLISMKKNKNFNNTQEK